MGPLTQRARRAMLDHSRRKQRDVMDQRHARDRAGPTTRPAYTVGSVRRAAGERLHRHETPDPPLAADVRQGPGRERGLDGVRGPQQPGAGREPDREVPPMRGRGEVLRRLPPGVGVGDLTSTTTRVVPGGSSSPGGTAPSVTSIGSPTRHRGIDAEEVTECFEAQPKGAWRNVG